MLSKADAERGCGLVPRNMIQFKFDGPTLTNHTVLEAQCVACGLEGHLASSCPEEILPQLSPLRPLRAPLPPPCLRDAPGSRPPAFHNPFHKRMLDAGRSRKGSPSP